MEKESKHRLNVLKAVLTFQCPHCGEESIFIQTSFFPLKNLSETKDKCSRCGTNLKPEPGFYFGAAYVSYGLVVGLWLALLVIMKAMNALGWIEFALFTHPKTYLITGLLVNVLLFPYLFRLSRSLWAYFFIH
jgi:predicted RNA-binding Zn-ribbon protein involved in translation (DUF1610 family)